MAIRTKALGDSGVNPYLTNASRTNEHLLELVGREGSIRYRQMSRGDDQIGMILRVHKNPIRSCSWGIAVPDDATDQEKLCIALLNKWIFSENKTSFSTQLNQILSCFEYGYSAFELIWNTYNFQSNKYFVPVLEQRLQTSIEEIIPKDQIVRQITIEKGLVEIPFEAMVFFILNQQGEDMRGESLLRSAYQSWKKKKTYEEWLGMGIQRTAAGGIPWMKVPKGTQPDSEDYLAAETLLQNISAHENAYMIFQEGWEFGITETKFNAEQIQRVIDGLNSGMALSVLAQFVLLGQNGNTGAFALSRDQSDFFLDGLMYIIDLVESNFNRYVIRPFVKINFGDSIDCSRIALRGLNLNKKAGQELATVLSTLKNSGFITATIDDEIQLRKSLDMPELSEDEIERRRELIDNADNQMNNIDQKDGQVVKEDDPQDDDPTEDKPTGSVKTDSIKLSETKANIRLSIINKANKEMLDFMKANLLLIKDKLMADIESTMNRGVIEIQGLKNIEISYSKYQRALEKKLSGIAYDAWIRAKKDAKSKSIKFSEDMDPRDIPSKDLMQFVLNQSASIAEQQIATLKARAILTASNGPLKGYSISQTLSNVSGIIDEFIDSNGVQSAGSLIVVGTDNFGASQFYKEIKEQLWGYRFVAVDDDKTSEICQWYNGKTFSVDSPELADGTPPLHPNCRSYMEPIYKSEEQKPTIDDVIAPVSIRQQKSVY